MKTLIELVATDVRQVTLDDAVETFLHIGLHNNQPITVSWYRQKLGNLAAYLGSRPLASIMDADLLDWCASLDHQSISPYTAHGYIRAVKRFFRWLHRRRVLDANPASELEKPRLPKGGHWGIPDLDARAMLRAAQDHPRDYAILAFVYSTGCRLEGVTGLLRSNIHVDDDIAGIQRQATVVEKFSKARTVFLDNEGLSALRAWLVVRPASDHPQVFLGRAPGEISDHPLTPRSVYDRFRIYAERAGVGGPWNPHEWRHNFGRRMAERGMPLGTLSQLMGHESVDTTVRFYGQFAVKQLQSEFEKFSRS